jgi:hypothetical protein
MRLTGIICIVLVSIGFAAKAQTREDFSTQPEKMSLIRSVEVFPNPTSDFVHVRIDQVPVQNVKITLHNIIGNEMSVETEVVDDHEVRIRVKDLVAGYYLLALKDEETKFRGTYKFLKK